MVTLLTKASAREARRCGVSDDALVDAIARVRKGLVDAALAATMIKQEVARPPKGRKTACRAIIAMRPEGHLAVIMHVYAKRDKANLTPRESDAYTELSQTLVDLSETQVDDLIRSRGWRKIGDK